MTDTFKFWDNPTDAIYDSASEPETNNTSRLRVEPLPDTVHRQPMAQMGHDSAMEAGMEGDR